MAVDSNLWDDIPQYKRWLFNSKVFIRPAVGPHRSHLLLIVVREIGGSTDPVDTFRVVECYLLF